MASRPSREWLTREIVFIAIAVMTLYFVGEYTCIAFLIVQVALGVSARVFGWRVTWILVGFLCPFPAIALIDLLRWVVVGEVFLHPNPICSSLAAIWTISSGIALAGALLSTIALAITHVALTADDDRRHELWKAGKCGNCEYDLRGIVLPRCPECGASFDPRKLRIAGAESSAHLDTR